MKCILAVILLFPVFCIASTLLVSQDGSSIYNYIQAAINTAADGDTVLVAAGTYNENISYLGKSITVASHFILQQDSLLIEQTIIDGQSLYNSDVYMEETNQAVLCGFTLINGRGSQEGGGGIIIIHCSPTINNVIIRNSNNLVFRGGGVSIVYSNPIFNNCTIKNNESFYGGGVYMRYYSRPTFNNCVIDGNTADYGGGVCIEDYSVPIFNNTPVINNTGVEAGGGIYADYVSLHMSNLIIAHNSSPSGGGILAGTCTLTLTDSILQDNHADTGGAIDLGSDMEAKLIRCIVKDNTAVRGGAIAACNGSACMVVNSDVINNHSIGSVVYLENSGGIFGINSIFWNNGDLQFISSQDFMENVMVFRNSAIQYGQNTVQLNDNCSLDWGTENIDADPLLADTVSADYHLQALSPCINTGTNYYSYVNYQGVNVVIVNLSPGDFSGPAPDIGAVEYIMDGVEEITRVAVSQNIATFPNPFNSETYVRYNLAKTTQVKVSIYNQKGQLIKHLGENIQKAGLHKVIWNGSDIKNRKVASGIYLVRIETSEGSSSKKITYVK